MELSAKIANKFKIVLTILTCIASAYLLFVGVMEFFWDYRLFIIDFDESYGLDRYTILDIINIIYHIFHVFLPAFVLMKLFVPNKTLIHKIIGAVLGSGGTVQLVLSIMISSKEIAQLIYWRTASFYQVYTFLTDSVDSLIIPVIVILIGINTFKPFIKNRAAIIICAVGFVYKTGVVLITVFLIERLFYENYMSDFLLRFQWERITGNLLMNTAVFLLCYIALKRNKKKEKESLPLQ